MSKISLVFLSLILFQVTKYSSAFCQENFLVNKDSSYQLEQKDKDSEIKLDKNVTWYQMVTNIPKDYANFFTEATNDKMIPSYIGIAALTGSLMTIDQKTWSFQRRLYLHSPLDNKTSSFVVNFGNGTYQFLGAALFAGSGLIFHDETALRTGSNIAEAVLTTGIFVQVLKRIAGRESPIASSETGGDWQFLPSIKQYQKNQPKYYSFPSGHLSTATAVLTVIANNYPNEKWIKPVGYPLLAILGFSLVNKGMHWYSDLPLAYFLGFTFGNIVAPVKSSIPSNSSSEDKPKLTIFPSVGLNDLNFNILYNF